MRTVRPVTRQQRKRVIVRLAKLMLRCQLSRFYLPPLVELAAEYRCSPRTVRRDLEALEEAGIAVPEWRQRIEAA